MQRVHVRGGWVHIGVDWTERVWRPRCEKWNGERCVFSAVSELLASNQERVLHSIGLGGPLQSGAVAETLPLSVADLAAATVSVIVSGRVELELPLSDLDGETRALNRGIAAGGDEVVGVEVAVPTVRLQGGLFEGVDILFRMWERS